MELPASIQEIADVIGLDSTAALFKGLPSYEPRSGDSAKQRTILYVPKRIKPDGAIVRAIGEEKARQLSEVFGGERIKAVNANFFARRERDAAIARLVAAGMSKQHAARAFGITDRQVRNIVRKPEIPGQELTAENDN